MSFVTPVSAPTFSLKEDIFSDFQGSSNPRPFSFSAGQMLRKAREAHNLTLDEVSRRLCLSKSVLEALEEGRFRDLSQGEAYIIGFVRSYARLVDVDPKRIVLQMKEELPPCENPPELIFPVPLPPAGHPKKLALLFSILVTVGGVFLGQEFLMKTVPSELAHHTPFVPVQVTISAPKDNQSIKAAQNADTNTASIVPSHEKSGFFSLIEPSSTGVSAESSFVPFVATDTKDLQGFSQSGLESSHSGGLVLEATEKSWIEVRDEQGNLHASKLLQPGEVYEVQGNAHLLLSTGNMGGLRVRQGEEIIESLGKRGAVRRKIPLTFANLKEASQN